ncbi:hypothetical protein BC833DRAFT_610404 [Globomyces pollinis-pini]|nr:hypothetical protein BC833DRAFT_610404 [Globomyces pollinis-pini]
MSNRSSNRKDFSKLRELRSKNETNLASYTVNEDTTIYDEVSIHEFNSIAKRAMLEDDFVVDDNGAGYANGLENWDDPLSNSDSDSDRVPENQKRKLKKKKKSGPITALFNNQAKKVAEKKIIKELEPDQNDKEFLQSLLVDFDENLSELDHQRHVKKPTKIHSNHFPLDKFFRAPINKEEKENTPNAEINFHHDNDVDMGEQYHEPEPSTKLEFPNETNSQHTTMNKNQSKINTNEIMPSIKLPELKIKSIQSSKSVKDMSKFLPKYEKIEKTLAVPTIVSTTPSNNQKWKDIQDNLSITTQEIQPETTGAKSSISESVLEPEGHLYFFWIDAFEKNGLIYLFGKILQKTSGKYISCCVTVQGMERNLFVLPRQRKVDANDIETDIPVTIGDVYQEIEKIRRQYNIKQIKTKQVNRQYAFELPNIPTESDYLKVLYPFTEPALNANTTGRTFSKIFGTQTNALELFLLKRKLMGPCWLRINNPQISTKNISWCQLEILLTTPKDIVLLDTKVDTNVPTKTPPLVVMSLNLRTAMNPIKNVNEIVACSALVYTNVNMDMDSSDLVGVRFTAVRQLTDVPWPMGFVDATRKLKTKVELPPNERALLSFLLAKIYQLDPDIIVGHNFIDFDLDVLLQRMKANRVDHWSRLGRLRRTVWPKMQSGAGGTGDSSFAEKQIVSGRLICDTFRAAKDFLNSKSNSLTYLSSTQLKIERCDIEYDKILSYFWDTQALIEMIQHCECDVYLVTQLMFKLQVIPLTKQLTTLAGNLWSRTMMGARSERNEFLLLHEFHSRKFICPDKHIYTNQPEGDDDEVVVPKKGRRKAAYAGGLVLEPKKGLYDKFVVMLDFNSLYPSIIQEFNICFTTVERTYDDLGDHMPDVPDCDAPAGVLPKVLKTLVDRRAVVKGLLKNPKNTPSQYAMYDIRQKALKLTANSMYGCLGFVHSRFFAKPLAMLITSKGREILQSTVQIAEESQLEVIYGDTDSIMINTNTLDIEQVKEIAKKLKTEVNKKYKILEIEMDGMYKRMLLLKKKKYAAVVMTEKNGEWVSAIETKGLDIVRRDWCDLSHDTSNFVLGQIFSAANCEDTVNRIHEYLGKVGEEVRAGLIPPTKFVINKGLTKRPEEYADKNTQPHVQVALRLISQGLGAKVGDTIPYVICRGTESVIAQRAYHIDELTKVDSGLELDLEWYLANQIHPPIARLCAPIEGTDNARLAVCLGLDANKYQHTSATKVEEEELYTLDSHLTDAERFKNVTKWTPICTYCQQINTFDSFYRIHNDTIQSSFQCMNSNCQSVMKIKSLEIQLMNSIRKHMKKYLDQRLVCDDSTCRIETRSIGVFGKRCLVPKCRGYMSMQYSDKDLYTQMQYYERLFDTLHVIQTNPTYTDHLRVIVQDYATHLEVLKKLVDRYLNTNSRRWVDLKQIFCF